MALLERTLSTMLTERYRLDTLCNAGIILCSLVESYMFPFAVIKWMLVATRYGRLAIKDWTLRSLTRSQHTYSLRLMTSCGNSAHPGLKDKENVSHLHVITEDDGTKKRTQLSYCGQDCQKIPPVLGKMYGAKVQCLDLSYNSVETLRGLEQFTRLEELVLDNNKLGDGVTMPYLPSLKTLSLNNNQISDLENFLEAVAEMFPSLSYLSLLSNKACPNQLSDVEKDDTDYQRYRYFVIYKLPCLRFLDSRRVSPAERGEAAKRGQFTRVRRPAPPAPPPRAPAARGDVTAVTARPLPVDFDALGKHKGAYGKCHYKYTGKHSEGNRFIVNSDL